MFTVGVLSGTKLHLSTIQENVILVVVSNILHHTAHNNINMFTIDVCQKNSDLVQNTSKNIIRFLIGPKSTNQILDRGLNFTQ
jgi:hypothetical protein